MFSNWMVADHADPSLRLPASKGTEILSKDLSDLSLSENYGKNATFMVYKRLFPIQVVLGLHGSNIGVSTASSGNPFQTYLGALE